MDYWNFESVFIILFIWQEKHIKLFENRGDQIFSQICPRDEIFWKSRQVWIETRNRGCDGIKNSGKKCKYWF